MLTRETLTQRDGLLHLYRNFLPSTVAADLFTILRRELAWAEESIIVFGKSRRVPRLVCWYGDRNITYRYSGVDHLSTPWTASLLDVKQRLEAVTRHPYNSVLGNLYQDGKDSMGWHADNEPVLGATPFIASLSLGAERIFKARHSDGETIKLPLASGSLLTMSGNFQNYWKHCVPKTALEKSARINLTFRYIIG